MLPTHPPAPFLSQGATSVADMSSQHVCTSCDHASNQWFGRCPACGAWSSAARPAPGSDDLVIATLDRAPPTATARLQTKISAADLVLGGGVVPGSVVLLAGEPGIGKSTLVLQLLGGLVAGGRSCLLVTGEESLSQVALRAGRLGLPLERLRAAASTSLSVLLAAAERERPEVLVVDSIQTLHDEQREGSPGSVTQVRGCACSLVAYAKRTATAILLVGHVTKEGAVAGPKALEHVVDAVLTLEGERSGSLRVLRATKNRFGSCEESGVLQMSGEGLRAVPDPSALLLADRRPGVTGSIVFPRLEGARPVLVEVQALVADSDLPHPRRVAHGVDPRRLALLLGVLAETVALKTGDKDVFVAAAGGLGVREPAADLALCLALFSAARHIPLPGDIVAFGEVGLGGETRRVPGSGRRLLEAARHGFRRAIVPGRAEAAVAGMQLSFADDLASALAVARAARAVA
jgi:DNA repair protein RadA/Sms